MRKGLSVTDSDLDIHGICRVPRLLALMQDAAAEDVVSLEIGRKRLLGDFGAVWMVCRTDMYLPEVLRIGTLEIETWHAGTAGFFWKRGYRLIQNGEICGYAQSMWTTVCITDGAQRVLRPENVALLPYNEESPVKEEVPRIRMPKDMEEIAQRRVRYSDLDYNAHLNNARAAEWVLDGIAMESRQVRVRELHILYRQACPVGETVRQMTANKEENCYYRALRDSGPALDALVLLAPVRKQEREAESLF